MLTVHLAPKPVPKLVSKEQSDTNPQNKPTVQSVMTSMPSTFYSNS